MADSTINIFGSSGEAMVGADTINTILASMGSKLTSDDINIETLGDGTVDVDVKNDTYTINLNHTHEGMAKLVKCTEATLPQTMADDTIYVQVDNATTPTEIEALHIFGLEFTGGGVPAGTPAITKPSGTTINLGENSGSGVSKTIEIKANRYITGDLTVGLAANSDLSFDTTNLPSGVTYNSGAGTLTISQNAAIAGVQITIVYSGSGAVNISDGLVITGGSAEARAYDVTATIMPLAYWDGEDSPVNGAWVDRENSMKINLFGTASKTSDGYQFNNLSNNIAAYARLDQSYNTLLNTRIDKEFTCVVEALVKFDATDKKCIVIDFGAFGRALGGISINAKLKDNGDVDGSFKHNGNTSTGFSDSTPTSPTGNTFTAGDYNVVLLKVGARLLQNGKQELFVECGNGKTYAILDTPQTVNFSGVDIQNHSDTRGAFAIGVGYMAEAPSDAAQYAANFLADVIIKSIQIYDKAI